MYNGKFVDISLENDYTDDDYQGKVDLAELNPFRYRSYYLDEETGLYYLNSRYYDAELGRFINADSLDNLDKESLNGLNLFAYCLNNPVNLTDSKGTSWWSDLWEGIKKNWDVIVGAIVSIVLIVVGVVLIAGSFGTLSVLAGLIGVGVGGFIGGLQSKLDGGSYWGGYLGGAVSGLFSSLGLAFFGPIGGFVGGFIGNLTGTAITDAINGVDQGNLGYWLNLIGESVLSGIVSGIGGAQFNKFTDLIKPIFKEIFIGFSVWSEFAFSALIDWVKNTILKIKENGINFNFVR